MEPSSEKQPKRDALPAVPFGRSFSVRVFLFTFAAMLLLIVLVAMIFLLQIPMHVPFLFVWLELAGSAVILSSFVAYRVTRPILTLARAARRITEGDSSIQIDLKRNDEIGQLLRFFKGTAKNVSESHEREVALSQIKSQFVTVAAHQLRTPLSALKWSLRLMLDGDMGEINEKQREFLQQSYQTNEHIIHLINDFLDISRIEEGRFGFQFKKTKILDIIQKAVDASMAQATMRGVRLLFIKDAPSDLEIIADESRMYTALINILDNAVRYSNAGGEVVARAALAHDKLEVSITDNGIGIPPKEQSKIFSRFYRASNAIRQQTEGSGLGLFIAKNIIERHGGTVTFTSEEQKGTTVFFSISATEDFVKKQEKAYQPMGETR
ncbi:MAG: hypothetical protein A3J55_03330 [Candidatus Ryanbacteria bacterium RIFCSPHIGHO2_02_FULL_45_17b]|uniref:histidine kinase n=1 Tax=Candidatus Ryanbacteria bacterium RIFCSPHIGHO2_01_FULL_45_22 TaxID=1802114 RepID=A0A1G2G2U8_9BACT|nr:MAG: hypothetical protein A2719_04530 [Candidatus Ryanbacteria bacterium RIFCSPHIGHO2_01_FULL_45_22]OGZ47493.1 MAG: hypothetical protein A3J55_03330 [Candidatus Ryanbacteria bacterium RIFCSPHIGHO2_02_FULL_45_17b]